MYLAICRLFPDFFLIFMEKYVVPRSGWLAVQILVKEEAAQFEGIAQGHLTLTIESPRSPGTGF